MLIYDLPKQSPRFVDIHDDVRMRCECCELATVSLAADRFLDVDWSGTLLGCPLCGWENRPADARGKPEDEEPVEDRNDGVSLDSAKLNFARYAWMYDPNHPPEWLGAPISREERELRERLRDVFPKSFDSISDMSERWELVLSLERALKDLVLTRERRTEAEVDPNGL